MVCCVLFKLVSFKFEMYEIVLSLKIFQKKKKKKKYFKYKGIIN